MNFDYLLLALTLIGLWFPSYVFFSSGTKEKLFARSRRRDEGFGALLASPVNWLDLIRSAGCTWLLLNSVFHFEKGQDELALVFTFVRLAILGIAVLLQTACFGRQRSVIGPVFFLTGACLVLAGPAVGGFAVALALTLAMKLRRLSILFLSAPVCLAAFAVIFGQLGLNTIASAGLFSLPPFLAFAFNTRLSFLRRVRTASAPFHAEGTLAAVVAEHKRLSKELSAGTVGHGQRAI